ncbi:MAG TPA: DedA family protein [Candidatus Baltobacteraceae bacterium]|nr:DedA family protein [Candidatus Baltobacteraceae bacterium]
MQYLTQNLHDLVVHFGYAGLFLVVVLGNLGMPAALEVVLPTAGGLAAQGHLPPVGPVPGWIAAAVVATAGELVGATILYFIGYYGGLPFVRRYGKYIRFKQHEYDRVQAFFARYGRSTVFWCRFIPFVRGVSSLPAGISRMEKRYFYPYTALGSVIFCFGLAYLGNLAGKNIDTLTASLHKASIGIVAAVVLAAIALAVVVRLRAKKSAPRDVVA